MAGALRPVVLLMLLASLLFLIDGFFDGAYPGGPAWFTGKYDNLAELSYVFAILNTVVAVMVARGSERSLQSRIGLSVFFLVERPITAFALGPKPVESVITHLATAGIELVILITALRVWRLGHAAPDVETLFRLDAPVPHAGDADTSDKEPRRSAISLRDSWTIVGVAIALAIVFVVDGIYEGYVPGGKGWDASAGSSAAVAVAVAVRAMSGAKLVMRALIGVALVLFLERSFTPFAMREQDPIVLALHALGAFTSLALALVAANAIRGGPPRERPSVRTLEAA
jgi:hypothetical protein